jgi:hypothetical protein
MIEVGKLYRCSEYFLLLYPDKDTAAAGGTAATYAEHHVPTATAAYWSKKFDKPVSYCNPLTPLLVLSVKEQYIEVLAGDKKGWIIYQGWLDIKEIR